VRVDGVEIAAIGRGLLALVAVERGDGEPEARRLAERVAGYRVFADPQGKMNLSLRDVGGELLAVPQFTLAADTNSGTRPSFSGAAPAAQGRALYERVLATARSRHPKVEAGAFGADMQVELVNDGPVTIPLVVR
jgi:D-tyrosyl-tRNA(Tyr) deacylase